MLDRTIAPPFQRTTHFELLKADLSVLRNNVPVHFISGGQQDVIKVEFIANAGRWYETQWGASHFTGNLISKGTPGKSSFEIAKIFDLYGAHLEISPALDVVSIALYSLTKNLAPVLELLLELLTEASFPEKELEQSKAIYLQNLKVNNEKTSFQASKLFRKSLFGENHPYGKELEEGDVVNIGPAVLKKHFTDYYKDLFVIVSGKISQREVTLIERSLELLPVVSSVRRSHTSGEVSPSRVLQSKEGSIQSSIRVGKRFIGRNHPDYFDVLLLNHILGGYFGSRLMKNIREEKGLTYGVYASIHTLTHDNYLVIGADVNNENVELTFDEIRKEFSRLRTEAISDEELNTARNHFVGSLQAEITTPFSHADKLKNIILYSLPADYYQKLIARMDMLTSADLIRAADAYYDEKGFFEVAVG